MLKIQYLTFVLLSLTIYHCSATVTIHSRIADGNWQTTSAIYPFKGQTVTLKVTPTTGATIRWYQIIPDISNPYKNANHPWEPNPYQWIGFANINYQRIEVESFRQQWEVVFSKSPVQKDGLSHYFREDMGSFWFQVEIENNGKITNKSPGLEQSDSRGISPKVFRVSFRDGEGYLGYLTSFFNIPGLFGSTTYQSFNYIGADCADVLMSAYSRWQNINLKKDYNVGKVINEFTKITELDIVQGVPSKQLTWGKDISPGNFLAVKYNGAKQYQHIGAIYRDENQNGVLDENDWVIHAGPAPLHFSILKDGNFDGHVVLLRQK